jgi:glutathione S-transferase
VRYSQGTSYILAVASSTFLLNTYHFILSASTRKAGGVAYPAAYATDEQIAKNPKALTFNCGMCCLVYCSMSS